MTDEHFEAWLGHMAADDAFLHRVTKGSARFGLHSRLSNRLFAGERFARGAGVGRVLAWRKQNGEHAHRQASARLYRVLLAGHAREKVRQHLLYLKQEGKGRDGGAAPLYARDTDDVDHLKIARDADQDRHQFRMVVSADDASEYEDLRPYVRQLMGQVARDLHVDLDWVAADHFDTGYPHSHVVIRGREPSGANLVIAPEYIRHGLPSRARELVSLDLGPKPEHEQQLSNAWSPEHEGPTEIDADLVATQSGAGTVAVYHPNMSQQCARVRRLRFLARMGLSTLREDGDWQLEPDFQQKLERLALLNEQAAQIDREVRGQAIAASSADYEVSFSRSDRPDLVGRVISVDNAVPATLIVDGVDGRVHHRLVKSIEELGVGMIVRIRATASTGIVRHSTEPEASISGGGTGDVEKGEPSPPQATDSLPEIEILSRRPLDALARWGGRTWLDQQLMADQPVPLGRGFGVAVRAALEERRSWLISEHLAEDVIDGTRYSSDLISILETRERVTFAREFTIASKLRFAEGGLSGGMRSDLPIYVGDQKLAIWQNGFEFELVPWASPHGLARDSLSISQPDIDQLRSR